MDRTSSTDRPYPGRVGRLPRRLDEITAEWLTETLDRRYPGIEVVRMTVLDVVDGHTTKVRVDLDLNHVGVAAGIAQNVCLKSNWSPISTGDICENEARFYHLVAGRLDVPTPRCYYADWDGDGGGRGMVVLDDLGCVAGRFGHSSDHLGIDGVADALESLALIHAARWDCGDDPLLAEIPVSMETPRDTELLRIMWGYLLANLGDEAHRGAFPDWVLDQPETLLAAYDALARSEQLQTGPRCLVHGDAHQGNTFLLVDGTRLWIDWQMARRGQPWRDVNYFVVGALTLEERRTADRDLLNHYRRCLTGSGLDGVASADQAWEQFQRWTVYGMQAWGCNVDAWGQGSGEMIRRFFAAGEDYGVIAELASRR